MHESEIEKIVSNAKFYSEYNWSPSSSNMPNNSGVKFVKNSTQTGLPYSSVKHIGRTIGEDIFLKTFKAALANPQSVLFTEDLATYGDLNPSNARCYYGIVCSKLTSFAIKHGVAVLSRFYGPNDPGDPDNRIDCIEIHPKSSTDYDISTHPPRVTDIVWYTGHVQIITDVIKDGSGNVKYVELTESVSPVAKTTRISAATFTSRMNSSDTDWGILRITNLNSYKGDNTKWLFPDYSREDPTINSVVLLDRGDWVPYLDNQDVKFNVMSTEATQLIIKHTGYRMDGYTTELRYTGFQEWSTNIGSTGVVTKSLIRVGQYESYCVLNNDTNNISQKNEFSICKSTAYVGSTALDGSTDIDVNFKVENAIPRFVFVRCLDEIDKRYTFFLDDDDRAAGKFTIPANTIDYTGDLWIVLVSENLLGRVPSIIYNIGITT